MHEARDAVDARLIAAGDLATLLATWLPTVQTRVYAAVRGSGADDVVQEIMLRLFRELSSGRRYPVPFRVVLHNVTGWLVKAHLRGDDVRLVPLDEDCDVPVEPVLEGGEELDSLLAELTPGERDAFELRFFHDLSAREVAARLGMKANAVDQAYDRAKRRLRELLEDG